jgi:hypothetical protein
MEIIFDTQTVTEAGFDTYLVRAMFPAGSTAPIIETSFTDASSLVGGIIGQEGILYLGSKQVRLDGKIKRIVINDGLNDRVIIGYLG